MNLTTIPESNQTATTSPSEEPIDMIRFLVLECSVAVFTVVTAYVTIAFLVYEWKRRGRRRTNNFQRNNRYGLAMRVESIVASVFLLARFACENYELIAQFAPPFDYCDVIVKTKVALSAVSILGVYTFLWTRQSFCYSDPTMQHLSSCATKAVSWTSLLLLLMAQLVGTVLFTSTRFYQMTNHGCYNFLTTIPAWLPWIWLAGATVCFQILLLGLFIFPLVKHRSTVDSSVRADSSGFLPIIKRATVTSLICIVTDVISSLLILLVVDPHDIIPTLVYDVTILINLICVLASFRDWRPRILAPLPCSSGGGGGGVRRDISVFDHRRAATRKPLGANGACAVAKRPASLPAGNHGNGHGNAAMTKDDSV